jgi:hypothetical protein
MKYKQEHPYKGPHQHEKPTEVDLQIGFLRYPDWHPLFWPYNDTLKDLHPKHPQMSPHCIGNLKAYLLEHPNLQPKLCDGNERDMMKKRELMYSLCVCHRIVSGLKQLLWALAVLRLLKNLKKEIS